MSFQQGVNFPTMSNVTQVDATSKPTKLMRGSFFEEVLSIAKEMRLTQTKIESFIHSCPTLKGKEIICFYHTGIPAKDGIMLKRLTQFAKSGECMLIKEDLYKDTQPHLHEKYKKTPPPLVCNLQTEAEMMRQKVFDFHMFLLIGNIEDRKFWSRFFTACENNPTLLKLITDYDKDKTLEKMIMVQKAKLSEEGCSFDDGKRPLWRKIFRVLLEKAFENSSFSVKTALSQYLLCVEKDDSEPTRLKDKLAVAARGKAYESFTTSWWFYREQSYRETICSLVSSSECPRVIVALDKTHLNEKNEECIGWRLFHGKLFENKDEKKKA